METVLDADILQQLPKWYKKEVDIYALAQCLNQAWHEMEKFKDMSVQNRKWYTAVELERFQEYSNMKNKLQEIMERASVSLISQLEIYISELLQVLNAFLDIRCELMGAM